MWIIDRYLLRQFLQTFAICWISLTGLYIVFDAFANLDTLLSYAEKRDGLVEQMLSFYAYKSVFFFDRSSAMISMVAAMFTATWIQRHNELTALMAAGVSRLRAVRPIIFAAASISVLAAVNREVVIPKFGDELSKEVSDLLDDRPRAFKHRYDNHGVLLRGQSAIVKGQKIKEPDFVLPASLDRYGKHVAARSAYYHSATAQHPAGYLFDEVTEPERLLEEPSIALDGQTVIFSPTDTPWLEKDQCFVASGVSFSQLAAGNAWRQFSSTPALIAGLSNPSLDFGADVRVTIHSRFTQPVLDITLLFLGLPLVLRRETRNIYLAIALCLGLVVVFMVTVFACQYMGSSLWLPNAALAAWLPLMIFVPAAVALFDCVER